MAETDTKRYKYSIDDWVTYIPFPDINALKDQKVVLFSKKIVMLISTIIKS